MTPDWALVTLSSRPGAGVEGVLLYHTREEATAVASLLRESGLYGRVAVVAVDHTAVAVVEAEEALKRRLSTPPDPDGGGW